MEICKCGHSKLNHEHIPIQQVNVTPSYCGYRTCECSFFRVALPIDNADRNLATAIGLLERALPAFENGAPDPHWFKDYFTFTGQHAIRTDEGWELGGERDYGPGEIEEEVNRPLIAQCKAENSAKPNEQAGKR